MNIRTIRKSSLSRRFHLKFNYLAERLTKKRWFMRELE